MEAKKRWYWLIGITSILVLTAVLIGKSSFLYDPQGYYVPIKRI